MFLSPRTKWVTSSKEQDVEGIQQDQDRFKLNEFWSVELGLEYDTAEIVQTMTQHL